MRTVFPQFNTIGEHGHPEQQDANECLTELLRILQLKLPRLAASKGAEPIESNRRNLVDQYFAGEFTCVMKNEEAPEETPITNFESFLQLSCFISQDVKYLNTGLKLRLEERLTKKSSTLGRDAVYLKTSRISRLPGYLCISLVRFFYKEKEKVSAKVLKDVKFPLMLDVFDLCTDELKEKLLPKRELFRLQEEDLKLVSKAAKQENEKNKTDSAVVSYAPYSFENDPGSSNSGYYELTAVLTHKGIHATFK